MLSANTTWTRLRRWLGPPELSASDLTQRAYLLWAITWGTFVFSVGALFVLWAQSRVGVLQSLLSVLVRLAISLVAHMLNQRGRTREGSWFLQVGVGSFIAVRAWELGGLHAPIAAMFAYHMMIAGLLLGERGAIFVALFACSVGAGLYYADHAGLLPPSRVDFTPRIQLFFLVTTMGISLLMQRLVARSLRDSLSSRDLELAERRRAQLRLGLALEAGKIAVWEHDLATGRVHAERRFAEIYGLTLDAHGQVSFADWQKSIHPDDLPRLMTQVQALLAGGPEIHAELRVHGQDGTERVVQAAAALASDASGARSMVGVDIDVTPRKAAERERERLLHDLRERVKDLTLLHGVARLLQDQGSSTQTLLQQVVDRIPEAWQYPECCAARIVYGEVVVQSEGFQPSRWQQTQRFATNEASGTIEVVYGEARPDADEGPFLTEERGLLNLLVEMLVAQLELRSHQRGLSELVATRTAQLLSAKEAAESASRAKSSFLAHMSHEIRTPMNAILGYAQLLQNEAGLDDAQRRKLDVIRDSGRHLMSLINDVLEMSRIEAGHATQTLRRFELSPLLTEVCSMFDAEAKARGLQLRLQRQPALVGALRADPRMLRQVLINLLGNALKFTEAGTITLRADSEACGPNRARVVLSVSDTGPGVPVEARSQIFEAFTQSSHGASKGGTGLGLTISRNFARLMGGDLTLEEHSGPGATFRFVFEAELSPEAMPCDEDARMVRDPQAGLELTSRVPAPAGTVGPLPPLPDSLLAELREAASEARSQRLLALADEVERHEHEAARVIRSLVNDFRYSELLQALQPRGDDAN